MPRCCVYTVLTGRYEKLNEQPVALKSSIPFICFTDDPDLISATWKIRRLTPIFVGDEIRSQRAYKLQPHHYLHDFDVSLYIDNSVLLKVVPEKIFDFIDLSSGLSIIEHSERETVADEFQVVARNNLDDPTRIYEQLQHYMSDTPEILEQKPFWSGIMLRDHRNQTMIEAMKIWTAHTYRYSRRDQLSNNFAFHKAGLIPNTVYVDNLESWFHSWPHISDRNIQKRSWQNDCELCSQDEQLKAFAKNDQYLEQAFEELGREYAQVKRLYEAILVSTTWRIMEPLRIIIKGCRSLFKWSKKF